jgi:hypothetical protein
MIMVYMGHIGWRHKKSGALVKEGPAFPPGPDYRPVVENVDVHIDDQMRPVRKTLTLKVISLWQPYASLIFTVKRHETRSWPWPEGMMGHEVGIHAALTDVGIREAPPELAAVCERIHGPEWRDTLPRGGIIGTVIMDRSTPTAITAPESAEDVYAGDWTPGRYASHVRSRSRWARPVPAKGQQGFWSITTDELNAAVKTAIEREYP